MRMRRLLKKATRIEVLHLGPDDALLVQVDAYMTEEEASRVRQIFAQAGIADDCIVVVGAGVDISVIRQECAA